MTIQEAKEILQNASASQTSVELGLVKQAIAILASSFARPPQG